VHTHNLKKVQAELMIFMYYVCGLLMHSEGPRIKRQVQYSKIHPTGYVQDAVLCLGDVSLMSGMDAMGRDTYASCRK